jgi:hypothetical protein
MEKQPLAATPGMFSVGIERTINLGNYENIRIGLVMSFGEAWTNPQQGYEKVKEFVDAWYKELKPTIEEIREMVLKALPPPGPTIGNIPPGLAEFSRHLNFTPTERALEIRATEFLGKPTWTKINEAVKAQGGRWIGTQIVGSKGDIHWEIPK